MVAQVANKIKVATWTPATEGGNNILKPRSQLFNLVKTDNAHSAGADEWASTTWVDGKWWQVTIGFDDANSVAALIADVDKEGTLVVDDQDANSQTVGRRWTWSTARLSDVQANQQHGLPGEFVAIFMVRASDGITNPLAVTTLP